jgi:hypothetical protein
MTWREAIGFPKKGWPGEDPELIERNQDAVAMTLDSRYSPESVAKMRPQGRNDVV